MKLSSIYVNIFFFISKEYVFKNKFIKNNIFANINSNLTVFILFLIISVFLIRPNVFDA